MGGVARWDLAAKILLVPPRATNMLTTVANSNTDCRHIEELDFEFDSGAELVDETILDALVG